MLPDTGPEDWRANAIKAIAPVQAIAYRDATLGELHNCVGNLVEMVTANGALSGLAGRGLREIVTDLHAEVTALRAQLHVLDQPDVEIIGAPVYKHNGVWFSRDPGGDETLDKAHPTLRAALSTVLSPTGGDGVGGLEQCQGPV
jgi:hypothetical protein